jgi:hypothetical protein
MTTETSPTAALTPAIERALMDGDLSKLTAEERGTLYRETCQSLGLNPLTMPFSYLKLNGKLVLYARRDCADQLRKLHGISIEVLSMRTDRDLFVCHVRARDAHGRTDEDVGFAVIGTLKGEALGNAELKALTKAKRRVTLSICGLGMLDETEVASIPGARTSGVDTAPAARTGDGEPLRTAEASEGVGSDERGIAPSHPDRPSADDIDALIALAEAANEPKELMATTLRRIMGLGGDVRISKKFLRERLDMTTFALAREHYEQLLRQQIEEDVPDHAPPADQVA